MHIAEEEHIADKTRSQAECGLSMDFLSSTDHVQYAGRSQRHQRLNQDARARVSNKSIGRLRLQFAVFALATVLVGSCGYRTADQPASDVPAGSSTAETSDIRRTFVSSSAIRSVGYDQASNVLEIEFPNGAVYQYYDVPKSVYQGLMNAESHGRYFHQHVRNKSYRYQKTN